MKSHLTGRGGHGMLIANRQALAVGSSDMTDGSGSKPQEVSRRASAIADRLGALIVSVRPFAWRTSTDKEDHHHGIQE